MAERPRWYRRFGVRLNAWYLVVFVGSLIAALGVADLALQAQVRAEQEQLATTHLQEVQTVYLASGEDGVRAMARRSTWVRVTGTGQAFVDPPEGAVARSHVQRGTAGDATIEVGVPDEVRDRVLAQLRTGLLSVASALGLAGGALLTRQVARPVRALSETAERVVASGDRSARAPVRGTGDELDVLAGQLNAVLERNEALMARLRQTVDHVAHDLRTPLTRMRGAAEVALRSDDPEALREALADQLEEADRVLALLRNLLDVAAAESDALPLDDEPVDLAALARQVVDLYEITAEDRGVELSGELRPTPVRGDGVRLGQVIANLVDNAVKYTHPGGWVVVRTGEDAARGWVEVEDDGRGITEADQARIFERLYRGDAARTEPGLGLGLAWSRAIVEAHGGGIEVSSTEGRGSRFRVSLPKNIR